MIIFYFFVILSLFSSRGQPFFRKCVIFISCFTMRKKELQKYVMLDRQKNSGKRDKKESEWILSCLLIHVDERVFPKTLYNVIIVHLLSLLQ